MLSRLLEVLCATAYAQGGDGQGQGRTVGWEEEAGAVVLGAYLDGLQESIDRQPGTPAAMLATFKLAEGFVRNAVRVLPCRVLEEETREAEAGLLTTRTRLVRGTPLAPAEVERDVRAHMQLTARAPVSVVLPVTSPERE